MISEIFTAAQDAKHAVYQAFERADLAAMMTVWAEVEARESWLH